MAKRASAYRIKSERTYTIAEAAEDSGVSVATVRQWAKDGLPVMTSQKPFLIVGAELKAFLQQRQRARQQKMGPDEFRCLRCKVPRRALGGMADLDLSSSPTGRLVALCECCEGEVHRFVSLARVDELRAFLDIAERQTSTPTR